MLAEQWCKLQKQPAFPWQYLATFCGVKEGNQSKLSEVILGFASELRQDIVDDQSKGIIRMFVLLI